jgi:hypothetical protein
VSPSKIARIVHSSCLRKENLTEEEANLIVDRAWQSEGLLLYFYKCEFCSSIHLTKQEPHGAQKEVAIS